MIFEVLAIKVTNRVSCFRPAVASKPDLKSIIDILLRHDLNWDRISATSKCFKDSCDSLNFVTYKLSFKVKFLAGVFCSEAQCAVTCGNKLL